MGFTLPSTLSGPPTVGMDFARTLPRAWSPQPCHSLAGPRPRCNPFAMDFFLWLSTMLLAVHVPTMCCTPALNPSSLSCCMPALNPSSSSTCDHAFVPYACPKPLVPFVLHACPKPLVPFVLHACPKPLVLVHLRPCFRAIRLP